MILGDFRDLEDGALVIPANAGIHYSNKRKRK
jgi:hypothetical protein